MKLYIGPKLKELRKELIHLGWYDLAATVSKVIRTGDTRPFLYADYTLQSMLTKRGIHVLCPSFNNIHFQI